MKIKLSLIALLALGALSLTPSRAGQPARPAAADSGPDGAKLWAQNCARCHNMRPQASYGSGQWDAIVHHMRVKAYLTGTEARAIADFLKSGN